MLANAKGTNIAHGMGTLKENDAFIPSLNLRIRLVRTSIGNVHRRNDRKVFVLLMLYILWCRQSERGLAKKQQQIPLQRGGGGVVSVCAVLKLNTIYLVLTLGHLAKSKHCVKEAAPLYSSKDPVAVFLPQATPKLPV